ncbi:MAG: AAA family ATPase [Breznakibacter sp.]|nr:AAA family ATPase [Breznakibacter sp.]
MTQEEISNGILANFGFQPTDSQSIAISELSKFFYNRDDNAIFILTGFAGTGKTQLISSIVQFFDSIHQPSILLAPTGRAAKVFSTYANKEATTIHRKIYWPSATDSSKNKIQYNKQSNAVFFVDEASMIPTDSQSDLNENRYNLLDDLMSYVFGNDNCKLVLIGDTAQLPPIGSKDANALSKEYLKQYSSSVYGVTLTDVVRQAQESLIIKNATNLRTILQNELTDKFPKLIANPKMDAINIKGDELIEAITQSFDYYGIEETMIITRSNKRATVFNNGVRNSILFKEDELSNGDILMVTKNNYFWTKENKELSFIANGDLLKVVRVKKHEEMYGFRFVNATVSIIDKPDIELDLKLILDSLQSDTPSLTRTQQQQLEQAVYEDYADLTSHRAKLDKCKENPYLNALQVKFGYAVTCHKAQGGQWQSIFIDQGYITEEMVDVEYFKWLYTAITRAQTKLYFVNFSDTFFE